MSLSTLVPETLAPRQPSVPATLLVVWQHPESRQMDPVALLDRDRTGYRLRYLTRARSVVDFRPLLGFGDLSAIPFS